MNRTAWIVAQGTLFLLCVNLLDVVLRKRYADSPEALAGWLVACFVLVVILARLSRSNLGPPATGLRRFWSGLDSPTLSLLAFFLVLLFLFHGSYLRAGSDGREYYVQVRSLVMDWDLDFSNENAAFGGRGTAARYAFGAALLWAPFFLLAHAWLGLLNLSGMDLVRDGYSNPYQMAVGLGTLVYGCAALLLIRNALRDYFSDTLAVVTTIALCAGSFVIWYLTVENSMVHGVSMFSTTLFLFLWHRSRQDRSRSQWAMLGAAAGLMAMARWQNALFVVFPVVDALRDYVTAWPRGEMALRRVVRNHGGFILAGVVAFFPQMWFWNRVRGHWLSAPVTEHGVSWLQTEVGNVLYSPHHGLFSTSPLMYVAALGGLIFLFSGRDRVLGGLLVVTFLAQLYVNSTVENWWGGAGFGARRFSNCALFFAIGLASALSWAVQRPKLMLAGVLVVFTAVNFALMRDVRDGVLPADRPITFDHISMSVYSRVGNPFSFPMNALTAWRFGGGMELYDRLGSQTFNSFRLDIGSGEDDRFLVKGWSGAEGDSDLTFRWSTGDESSLVAPIKEAVTYRLRVRCEPFAYPGSVPQVMQIIVNGKSVESLLLDSGWRDYEVNIPDTSMRVGPNEVRFGYLYAVSPRSVSASSDGRQLAVRFQSIELLR